MNSTLLIQDKKSAFISRVLIGCFAAGLISWRYFDYSVVLLALAMIILYWDDVRQCFIQRKPISGRAAWLIPLWVSIVSLSYVIQPQFGRDQLNDIFSFRWIIAVYFFVWAGRKINIAERFLNSLFITTSVLLTAGLIWQFDISPRINPAHEFELRVMGFFHNPNHYALSVALLFAFCMGIVAISLLKNAPVSRPALLAMAISGLCTFGTQTRSAWFGCFVVLAYAIFLLRKDKRIIFGVLLCCAALVLMYIFDLGPLKNRLDYTFDSSRTSSTGARLDVWKANFQMFLDHWLLGTGFYENVRLLPEYYKKMNIDQPFIGHAHNQYLQLLAGTGILGLAVYLVFFVTYLRFFWKQYVKLDSAIAFASVLVILTFLAESIAECPFNLREPRSIMVIILGTAYGFLTRKSPLGQRTQV